MIGGEEDATWFMDYCNNKSSHFLILMNIVVLWILGILTFDDIFCRSLCALSLIMSLAVLME
jgi:hypothetical protein